MYPVPSEPNPAEPCCFAAPREDLPHSRVSVVADNASYDTIVFTHHLDAMHTYPGQACLPGKTRYIREIASIRHFRTFPLRDACQPHLSLRLGWPGAMRMCECRVSQFCL